MKSKLIALFTELNCCRESDSIKSTVCAVFVNELINNKLIVKKKNKKDKLFTIRHFLKEETEILLQ